MKYVRNEKPMLKNEKFFNDDTQIKEELPGDESSDDEGAVNNQGEPAPKKSKKKNGSYKDVDKRTQERRTKEIRDNHDPDAIIDAALQVLRERKEHDLVAVIKKLLNKPDLAKKVRGTLQQLIEEDDMDKRVSTERALALILLRDLSREDYECLAYMVNAIQPKMFPSYPGVSAEKHNCQPPEEFMFYSDHKAEGSLKNLLHHTIKRIMLIDGIAEAADNLVTKIPEGKGTFYVYWKYGFDGATSTPIPNQKHSEEVDEGAMFASHIVIINIATVINEKLEILYNNVLCNDAFACRPLRIQRKKETDELTLAEHNWILDQVKALGIFEWSDEISFEFVGIQSMMDGKCINAVVGNKCTAKCPYCLLHQQMNTPEMRKKMVPPESTLDLMCLSILHYLLRLLEHFLNVGKRKGIRKFQAEGGHKKNPSCVAEMKIIQDAFIEKYGIHVSEPRQGGKGNSNTGTIFCFIVNFFDLYHLIFLQGKLPELLFVIRNGLDL